MALKLIISEIEPSVDTMRGNVIKATPLMINKSEDAQ